MHFLLLLLRFVLDRLIPTWRDGLKMAIRADGRIEQIPTRLGMWGRWLSLLGREILRQGEGRRKVRAERCANGRDTSPRDRAARA